MTSFHEKCRHLVCEHEVSVSTYTAAFRQFLIYSTFILVNIIFNLISLRYKQIMKILKYFIWHNFIPVLKTPLAHFSLVALIFQHSPNHMPTKVGSRIEHNDHIISKCPLPVGVITARLISMQKCLRNTEPNNSCEFLNTISNCDSEIRSRQNTI